MFTAVPAPQTCEERMARSSSRPLFAVVTGRAHSGTTILSMLIKNAPGVFGGLEGGMLLARTPAELNRTRQIRNSSNHRDRMLNFVDGNLLNPRKAWNVSAAGLERLAASPCAVDLYERLLRESPLLRAMGPRVQVLDKFPEYERELSEILWRAPGVPFVVSEKGSSPDAHERAQQRRAAFPHVRHTDWQRIHFVRHEELLSNPSRTMRSVFSFLGLGNDAWRDSFLNMSGVFAKLAPVLGQKEAAAIAQQFSFCPAAAGSTCQDLWRPGLTEWRQEREQYMGPVLPAEEGAGSLAEAVWGLMTSVWGLLSGDHEDRSWLSANRTDMLAAVVAGGLGITITAMLAFVLVVLLGMVVDCLIRDARWDEEEF